ncbi:hypothetical protein NW752_002545 [Fusarium irregulare]|uniref:Uncharacterized protein n=1 Tax=Fusarium irregulare TaxID=2494466 RepID=A0A9W8PCZ1_9HYPO|nr:hypothetical protein NW766_012757 [Fusarium irregulare]KAJ4025082.1 hypothetical protein NW752_002545 [Fusarium irregulare]
MSLPRRFSITIDGMPVAMPKSDPRERPQAEPARNGERPAVFEIVENHLVCGELVMGRSFMEDRSLMPKRVIWSPIQEMNQIQPIRVEQGEDGPELRLQDGKLAYLDGRLFSPILPDMDNQKVILRPEPF